MHFKATCAVGRERHSLLTVFPSYSFMPGTKFPLCSHDASTLGAPSAMQTSSYDSPDTISNEGGSMRTLRKDFGSGELDDGERREERLELTRSAFQQASEVPPRNDTTHDKKAAKGMTPYGAITSQLLPILHSVTHTPLLHTSGAISHSSY